ncbi:MAG: RHS repeat-associated core domain-containing protein, partial [Magnetococcales bacterium]|nr:RHS repeat-associated core domain-containing protein [Magnetococcales bacterium]
MSQQSQTSNIFDVPNTQTFQFSGGGNGTADPTINLFQGALHFSVPLASLKGRSGLNIGVYGIYNSIVSSQVTKSNRDAPTGVLGLGWLLGLDRIDAEYGAAGNRDGATFYLTRKEIQNRLYRTDRVWQRGVLDASLATDLDQGALSEALLTAFLAQSLVVDASASVTVVAQGQSWTITDSVNEFLLDLELDQGQLLVLDGGDGYEPESFDFSQVRHYAPFERWEVTTTDGLCAVFGGGLGQDDDGYRTSRGNAVTWGVRWNNWSGPSTVSHASDQTLLQDQYPQSWYLSSERALCRDEILYVYSQTTQQVGSDGLPYTKAIYLNTITDMFGQWVQLNYADKEYNQEASLAREYLDPYKAVPNQDPDAYQSGYETQYLASVACYNDDGALLYTTELEYELGSFCAIAGSAPDTFLGDTCKRTLTGVATVLANGCQLPAMRFTYHGQSDTNPGAMATRVLPEGATLSYTYQQKQLGNCSRSLRIDAPLASATPRIWFGADYAVVLWIDSGTRFSMAVYTWTGRWVQWQPATAVLDLAIDKDDVTVNLQDDFFTIDFALANGESSRVLFYHKNIRILGGWLESSAAPLILETTDRQVVTGDRFFAVANGYDNTVARYTWDNTAKVWDEDSVPTPAQAEKPTYYRIFLTAAANLLPILYYDIDSAPGHKQSLLILDYLDESGSWHTGDQVTAVDIAITGTDVEDNFQWSAAEWVFAATYVTEDLSSGITYAVALYTWGQDGAYTWNTPFIASYQLDKTSSGDLPCDHTAQVTDTGLVVSGPYLLRFNGSTWLSNDTLKLQLPVVEGTLFWFATGSDIVVKSENSTSQIIACALAFDPNTQSDAWDASTLSLYDSPPNDPRLTSYFPSAAPDFITLNDKIYYRGTSTDWSDAIEDPVYKLPDGSNNTTLINEATQFMVYQTQSGGAPSGTDVLVLNTCYVDSVESLPENFYQMVASDGTLDSDTAGKFPAGNGSFVTFLPLDDTLDQAQSITLYRYLNDSITDPITDYPILTVTIDDGFIQKLSTYTFDESTAAVASQGNSCKYYQVTQAEGTDNGYTQYTFINSVGTLSVGNPTLEAVLDGQLDTTNQFDADNTLVASRSSTWSVVDQIQDVLSGATCDLNGVFVQLDQSSSTLDGVTALQEFQYDARTGQVSTTQTTTYNAQGQSETHQRTVLPGYATYPWMAYVNRLRDNVQVTGTVTVAGGAAVVLNQQVVTWSTFAGPDMGSAGTLQLLNQYQATSLVQGSDSATATTAADTTSGTWLTTSQVNVRNAYGYVQETQDAMGLVQSTLHDSQDGLTMATFSGTSLASGEAYYFGFESYEDPGAWALDYSQTPLVTSICNTGSQCLSLPPGVTGTPLELTPDDLSQVYLFSFWGRIDPTATAEISVVWEIDYVSTGTLPDVPASMAVTSTDWAYCHALIDLTGCSAAVTVRLTPVNRGSSTVYVDNVCFASLIGQARIAVYDTTYSLRLAAVGPYDQLQRMVYDRYNRQIALTNDFQAVQNVVCPYLSRQTQDAFDPSEPNSNLVVQPMGETCYLRFLDNGVWSDHFTSETPDLWTSANGFLTCSGGVQGSITFSQPSYASDYFFCFQLTADQPQVELGILIGSDVTVTWSPVDGLWSLMDTRNDTTLAGRFTSSNPSGQWMIVLSSAAIIMALEGRILFDYLPSRMPTGQPGFFAGDAVALSHCIIGGSPQVGIRYFDGAGKTLQGQSIEDSQSVVAATQYDALARPVVMVKPVTYAGQTGSLVCYRDDVVTSFDWDSGLLTGTAATSHPDDGGYPYLRHLLESSPLARVIEVGAAGQDFAITNLSTTSSGDRHTIRHAYGCNGDDAVNTALGWPVGQYFMTTVTDQDGNVTRQFKDTLNRPAAAVTFLDAAQETFLLNTQVTTFSSTATTHVHALPNAFNPPAGSTATDWVNSMQCDFLGRVTQTTSPNSGTSTFLYNKAGQRRLWQDPLAAAQGVICYCKYDTYGRTIEKGLVTAAWDSDTLQTQADASDWPTAADGAQVVRSWSFDGDGSVLTDLGHLVSVAEYDETSHALLNTTSYGYDAQGNLTSQGLTLAADGLSQVTSFSYDTLGNVAGTTYPSGYSLALERDSVGRVIQITDGDGQVLAAYTYRNDDLISQVTCLPSGTNPLTITKSYNSPGWVEAIASTPFSQTLAYTAGAYGGSGYYSGRIAAVTGSFQLAEDDTDFPASLSYAYDYDLPGRLIVAEAVTDQTASSWSLGLDQPVTYDANGNLLTLDEGGALADYQYQNGTDRVLATDGSDDSAYSYNALGAVTSAVPGGLTQIDYALLSRRATAITTSQQGTLQFQYDSRSNRVVKTSGATTRLYQRGINGWPLVEIDQESGTTTATTEYLYGPDGLFALRIDGNIHPILKDHLHSVRAVVDSAGTLQTAFHYSPFGAVIASTGDTDLIRYRFTGYEYDGETGLYNAAARLYDPALKRFYSVDPRLQFFSPYVYGGSNPVSMLDPTGEAAWWAILVGAVVGVAVTVATGGAGAVAFGMEEGISLGASTAVAAASGAVGSVAGDATTAGLSGEKFTGRRALVDLAAGAAGGAAGELLGGQAAKMAMTRAFSALENSLSVAAVSRIGTLTAGVVGGLGGAVAASGVAAAMTGHAFFGSGTAFNALIGGVAGFGGAVMASGAHLGWGGNTMPVPLGASDVDLIAGVSGTHQVDQFTSKGIAFSQEPVSFSTLSESEKDNMSRLIEGDPNSGHADVIGVHGVGRFVMPDTTAGYRRPMSGRLFAKFLAEKHSAWVQPVGENQLPPIKLYICFSALPG